jgi:copper(I)-binding protein
MRAKIVSLVVVLLVGAALAGCSGAGASSPAPSAAAGPTIDGAWVRPAAAGSGTAAYLTIRAGDAGSDTLLGASSPDAASVDLHETTTDASGMMGMHPAGSLEVPAGGIVTLEPGGFHLMVMGLTRELAAGGTFELDLDFANAGRIVVQAEVRQG